MIKIFPCVLTLLCQCCLQGGKKLLRRGNGNGAATLSEDELKKALLHSQQAGKAVHGQDLKENKH